MCEDDIRVWMDFNFSLQGDMIYALNIYFYEGIIDWILFRDSRFSISTNCISNIIIFQSFMMIFFMFCVMTRYIQTLVDWLRYITWARRILEYELISTSLYKVTWYMHYISLWRHDWLIEYCLEILGLASLWIV